MTVDLTKITTPFGLLDADTRAALMAHGGPYEFWHWARNEWRIPDADEPNYATQIVYRVKPAPPKPREWWCVGAHMHETPEKAEDFLARLRMDHPSMNFGRVYRVIEVIE